MLDEPIVIKIDDKEMKVEGFTQTVQSAFEQYMSMHLVQDIKSMRKELGDDYLDVLQKHISDFKSGQLAFGTKMFFRFIENPEHFGELMQFVLSKYQPFGKDEAKTWCKDHPDEAVELFNRLFDSKKNCDVVPGLS